MGKNVIPFRRRQGAPDADTTASRRSRVTVGVGPQPYAIDIDITCTATALPTEPDPAVDRRPPFGGWGSQFGLDLNAKWTVPLLSNAAKLLRRT